MMTIDRLDILCGHTNTPYYYAPLFERGIMNVNIKLPDFDGDSCFLDMDSDPDDSDSVLLSVNARGSDDAPDHVVKIKIEDLKLALRKFSAK